MKNPIMVFGLSLFLCFSAGAKPTSKNKVKASPPDAIRLVVNYGDKVSQFEIIDKGKSGKLNFQQNQSPIQTKALTADEISYLKERMNKLPALTNEISLCPRSFIHLVAPKHNKIGCIGGQNTVAKELQEMADLLSSRF